jgi:hypothetical protein
MLEVLSKLLADLTPKDILAVLFGTIGAATLLLNSKFRNRLVRTFFLSTESEPGAQEGASAKEISELRAAIQSLQEQVNKPLSEESAAALRRQLDVELYSHVPDIVQKHLERLRKNEDALVQHFDKSAEDAAVAHLKGIPFSDLISSVIYRESWEAKTEGKERFVKLMDGQLNSANATRIAMMNLFVFFSISLLALFLFAPSSLSDKTSLSILGVYVSLSAFIIYIYRASNARSAALLSIREDEKKLFDVFLFLTSFKKTSTFTNNDVELIKLLLVNRFEREKGADHPYEVILKGVTNSNVLVRGGKVSAAKAQKGET